ncbi:trigger factor [Saccharomonospora viridis]|uniref:Trigger factor n=1 Tax=Saccharomonospora viridis TaxID=1852 RepID=A0A837D3L2_9PSEU|nr:trigger factor [Saccharomonospora viridis]KHF42399.1 trigger factor [Saccharomonospora viridis]SFP00382.1 trigger factor [Saccharomonospora viridis]
MKSTVEQLSPTRVKINVEVPFDELKPNFDRAYRKIAQQVRIPGFRPGKAPARVLESRIGRAPVLDEVINEAIPAKYLEAVRSSEVRTLGQPEFEVTKLEDREVLEFTAEVDVRPEITLPDLDDLTVSVDDVELDESEVDEQLDQLRARFGVLKGVDRPAENGDFVSIDLSATVDGEEVPDASTTGLSYEIGSGQLVEGIDEAIIGANEGETKTFTTKLVAGEHAGKDAEVTVKVNSIKERELPEADDEFAQLASEFDTLDELKADLRERLLRMKRVQQGVQARDKVLEELLNRVEVPVPEKVLEAEIANRKHDAIHPFDHDEEAFKRSLEAQGGNPEEWEKEVREEAEKSVRTQLLLDAIADARDVSVSDSELTERIIYQAQRFGMNPDEYVQRAQEAGQLGAIYADVRRGKALAEVVREVTVTDASGQTLDLSELFGTGDDSSQAADSASNEDTASDEGSSEDGASKDADESSSTTDR